MRAWLCALLIASPALAAEPAHRWEFGLSAGTGAVNGYFAFFGYVPRFDLRLDARAIYAVDDRLAVDALWPSAEYRFAPAKDIGALAWGGVLAFSVYDDQFLYQTPQEATVVMPPVADTPRTVRATLGAGGALRLTRPRHDWAFSLQASTTRPFSNDPLALPFFTVDIAVGLTVRATARLSFHLALGVENSAALVGKLFTTPPVLTIGSVQRLGLRRPPLVRFELLDGLYIDATAGAWLGTSGRIEGELGVTWLR